MAQRAGRLAPRRRPGAAQDRLDPGHQFARRKRLGDIIVGAQVPGPARGRSRHLGRSGTAPAPGFSPAGCGRPRARPSSGSRYPARFRSGRRRSASRRGGAAIGGLVRGKARAFQRPIRTTSRIVGSSSTIRIVCFGHARAPSAVPTRLERPAALRKPPCPRIGTGPPATSRSRRTSAGMPTPQISRHLPVPIRSFADFTGAAWCACRPRFVQISRNPARAATWPCPSAPGHAIVAP